LNWEDPEVKSDAFSLDKYARCLRKALDLNYAILQVRQTTAPLPEKCLILRHDIEYSVDCALRMAELEHEHGLRSSYFVLAHSVFYNPFTPQNTKKIRRIIDLGHEIGLHYETYYFEDNDLSPVDGIRNDVSYMERMFDIHIHSVSQHRPARSSFVEELGKHFIDAYRADLIYGMYYISDSSCKWRSLDLYESLGREKQIHALVHPDNWSFTEKDNLPSMYRAIARANSQEILDECELAIELQYDYLKRRKELDRARRERYRTGA
jgi:hypothetical protein